jgi:AcrR family transcriptional regulator
MVVRELDRNFDKRVERSKAKVLAETYRQLAASGIGGVSIDEITKHSGVSKTTIYRHWPSRSALLIDACSRLGGAMEAPDTGSLKGDLQLLLDALADQLSSANWSSVYPSIIDAAERDPELREMQAALHRGFMEPFSVAIERAKTRGEVAAGCETSRVIGMAVGSLFFRRWFSRDEITAATVTATLEIIMMAVQPA